MIATILGLLVALIFAATFLGLGYSWGNRVGFRRALEQGATARLLGSQLPPRCSHIDARWSRWIWNRPEKGYSSPIKVELYCTDCGETFMIPLPVSSSASKIKKSEGGPGWKQIRLALEAKGWKYDKTTKKYLRIR